MKITFTLNNMTFESNDNQTYFYAIWDGKKQRIKKREFEQAQREFALIEAKVSEESTQQVETVEETATKTADTNIYCRHPYGEDLSKPAEFNEFGCVDCSKCNVQECVHRDCMRRNPTWEGGLGECPRLKVEATKEIDTDDWNDMQDSRNAWTAVDEITYDVVASAVRSFNKTDAEVEEIMGIIGKDAKIVMEFNDATSNLNADEFNSYIKARLDAILNGGADGNTTESLTEATEAHEEAETTENTPDSSNATESLGEATENASEKKATKRTNKRVSKNTAWGKVIDNIDVSLTSKQVDFINHLPDTCFWEDGLDSVIWVDCLCDDIGGQFAGKPMTVGAMISTLCEKKLSIRATERRDGKKCTSFALTELGKKVAGELGLH